MNEIMKTPLISIIITVLNGEETLEQSLNSIRNQNFNDYELVIVDGGSEDGTVQIINASDIVKKIVCIAPKIGLYAGLNAGIGLSNGEWLYFMGADDKLHSYDTLQRVSEIIKEKKNDAKVIVGNVACVKQNYLLRPRFGSPYFMRHLVHHQGMFYDKNIFANSLYNENMRIASDYEFNLKLALTDVPHQSMDIIICDFGGDGISENQFKKGYEEMQQVHNRLFHGLGRYWATSYFWLRRRTGTILRNYNLSTISAWLKKI